MNSAKHLLLNWEGTWEHHETEVGYFPYIIDIKPLTVAFLHHMYSGKVQSSNVLHCWIGGTWEEIYLMW